MRTMLTQTQTAPKILALLRQYSAPLYLGEGSLAAGPCPHLLRVEAAVAAGRPVRLVLPAFPAKSPNRQKTLGPLPDYAEVLGLERLENLCREIAALHAPGAELVICSDGRVFSDLVGVSDADVSAYGAAIRAILEERGLKHLSTFSMEDSFAGGDFSAMRAYLEREYAANLDDVRAHVTNTLEGRTLFNGIHRFLFEDGLALTPEKSRNRVREETKPVAYRVIQRSNAWSRLVAEAFPEAVRLSIHPQFASAGKIGIPLVSCPNPWGTPWHNVAVLGAAGFRLAKRAEVEARGAALAYAHGKYAYFIEETA